MASLFTRSWSATASEVSEPEIEFESGSEDSAIIVDAKSNIIEVQRAKADTTSPREPTAAHVEKQQLSEFVDFMSMANPSPEAIARSHVAILKNNVKHLESKLENLQAENLRLRDDQASEVEESANDWKRLENQQNFHETEVLDLRKALQGSIEAYEQAAADNVKQLGTINEARQALRKQLEETQADLQVALDEVSRLKLELAETTRRLERLRRERKRASMPACSHAETPLQPRMNPTEPPPVAPPRPRQSPVQAPSPATIRDQAGFIMKYTFDKHVSEHGMGNLKADCDFCTGCQRFSKIP